MKAQEILPKMVVAFALLGASATALAVECSDGIIQDQIVKSIEVNGQPCLIIGASVREGIVVKNSPAIVIVETDVNNSVLIETSDFIVVANIRVQKGSLIIKDSGQAAVKDNNTKRDIRVVGNQGVTVNRNSADRNMVCRTNARQDAFLNRARGSNSCR